MKDLNVIFSYKYVNVSGVKHLQEVVFNSGEVDVPGLRECEKKLREAFVGKKNDSFIASQLEVPDLFYFVPNYEKDSCWHMFIELDFTAREVMDTRTIEDFADLAEKVSEGGWEKFDVLEKITGRIPSREYQKEIELINKNYTREIETLNRDHGRELELVKKNGTKELELLKKNYMKEMDLITRVHEKETELTAKSHRKELESMNKTYEKEIESIKKNSGKDSDLVRRRLLKTSELLKEAAEVTELYLEGEVGSDDLEKLAGNIKKLVVSL